VGEVLKVIQRLAEEHDLTMLLVTHEMDFARRISDRICFFDQGAIREEGTPEQIFTEPQNERTREFLHAVLHPEA
jgi:polar amino acid transport system ATP-binding protein